MDARVGEADGRVWRILAAGAVGVAGLLGLGPVLVSPLRSAVGLPDGEGPAHLWGLWVTTTGLLRHGPFLRVSALVNAPDGFRADLMDPISLLVFVPGWLVGGPVLGWNLLHLAAILLAGWGGWRLARAAGTSDAGAAVAAAAVAGAPYLLGGLVVVGRTEYLPLTLWPLHLSFLLPSISTPSASARDRAGAVLSLAALAHAGWQPLTWIALINIGVAAVWLRGLPRLEAARRLAWVVTPAALLALPLLWTHLSAEPWWLARLDRPSPFDHRPRAVPIRTLLPFVEVTRSWANNPLPYLGLVLPALAAAGAVRAAPARRWLLLGLGILVFAMGEIVCDGKTGPDATRFYYMPAAFLMHLFPPLRAFHGWARLTMRSVPALAVAAAVAVDALCDRLPAPRQRLLAVGGLSALLLLEGGLWHPVGSGSFTIAPSAMEQAALATLPPGAVLELPCGTAGEQSAADAALLRAQGLRRATSLAPSPYLPAALRLSAYAQGIERGVSPLALPCAESEVARLRAAGFAGVTLDLAQISADSPVPALLTALLGQPTATAGQLVVWRLPHSDGGETIPEDCTTLSTEGLDAAGP